MNRSIFAGFIFICLTRTLGVVFLPALLKFSPLLLILASPFLHHLMLTSSLVPAALFLPSAIVISAVQCTLGFEFGRIYGTRSLEWSKRFQLVSESKIQQLKQWMKKSAALVLFLIPGPYTAMVSGSLHVEKRLFYPVMLIAQIFWVGLCFFLGTKLDSFFTQAKIFLVTNWIPVTLILFLVVLGSKLLPRK